MRHSTYHPHDDSINSVMMIALFNFKVKHIVVTVSRGLAGPPLLPQLTRPGPHQLRRLQSGSQRLKAPCRPGFHLAAAIPRPDCDPREVSLDRGWTAHLGPACRGECRAAGQEPPSVGHHRRGEAPVPPQALDTSAKLTFAQDWRRRGVDGVTIHGWVYHLEDVGGL